MDVILGAVELGLIFSLVPIGIYLTLRIIDFPDLTVNSSFTLGAAVSGIMLLNGFNPIISTFCAGIAGALAGFSTALLNIKIKIQNLLAGIMVMLGLYSINLRIMGKPNISLIRVETIFQYCPNFPWIITLIIVILISTLLSLFLLSEIGLGIRASGQNYKFGESYGVSRNFTITTILSLSNAIVALSGSLFCQMQGFIDISMGNGVLIIGLVSVIIGEKIIRSRSIYLMILSCVLGAIIYKLVIALALEASSIGLKSSDIYLVNAILIILFMMKGQRLYK